MKVTAIVGSARKKHTYKAAEMVLQNLKSFGEVEYEIISLNDYNLQICKGCKVCLDKHEDLCPLDDDREIIINKMKDSDGVIFASPNYSFHVSGQMKVFLDRLGYFFHRPFFFGKAFTSIVAQAVYGSKDILKYFSFIGSAMGFNITKGICITTLEPISMKNEKLNAKKLNELSKNYFKQLMKSKLETPSIFDLMIFRISRTVIKLKLDESFRDYNYFKEHGWFSNDFYYPVKLNIVKKMLGRLCDVMTRKNLN